MNRPFDYWILWVLVIFLSAFNVFAVLKFLEVKNKSVEAVSQLTSLLEEPIQTTVNLDKPVSFSTSIDYSETLRIPVSTTIPINTTVEVPISLPLAGSVQVRVPIKTNIPVNLDLKIPISVKMPVKGSTSLDSVSISIRPFEELVRNLKETLQNLGLVN